MKTDFTIGADPEMFCVRNGGYVAVQTTNIVGTKEEPQLLPNGGNVQRDNVAVEFAIDPASSKRELINSIGTALADLKNVLPKDVDIEIVPSADFPRDQLRHEECMAFGCSPDFSAWTMMENVVPVGAEESVFRSCGGHIHLGYVAGSENEFLLDEEGKLSTVRMMDALCGVISTVLDNSKEAIARRKLYGKAGCYRPTIYGIEYRTLSNYWIQSPLLVSLMYSLSADALHAVREGKVTDCIKTLNPHRLQRVIETGDAKGALHLFELEVHKHMTPESIDLFANAEVLLDERVEWKKEWEGVQFE